VAMNKVMPLEKANNETRPEQGKECEPSGATESEEDFGKVGSKTRFLPS